MRSFLKRMPLPPWGGVFSPPSGDDSFWTNITSGSTTGGGSQSRRSVIGRQLLFHQGEGTDPNRSSGCRRRGNRQQRRNGVTGTLSWHPFTQVDLHPTPVDEKDCTIPLRCNIDDSAIILKQVTSTSCLFALVARVFEPAASCYQIEYQAKTINCRGCYPCPDRLVKFQATKIEQVSDYATISK